MLLMEIADMLNIIFINLMFLVQDWLCFSWL
jgi:hypothetical protein